ncbi:MAG: WW domain-containing protein, partial [Terriglobus roseus]|nr:WW domain-containing protein [Terriglobus roseus]
MLFPPRGEMNQTDALTSLQGHKYYYNPETKVSTYTRPSAQPQFAPVQHAPQPADYISLSAGDEQPDAQQWSGFNGSLAGGGSISTGGNYQRHNDRDRRRPQHLQDRPKHRYNVPGCEPWVLVKTRLGRRFVHNADTGESVWRFPEHVMKAVVAWDVQRLREKEGRGEEAAVGDGAGERGESMGGPRVVKPAADAADDDEALGSDEEYEEVEVTDDEEGDNGDDAAAPSKRQRTATDDGDEDEEEYYVLEEEEEE